MIFTTLFSINTVSVSQEIIHNECVCVCARSGRILQVYIGYLCAIRLTDSLSLQKHETLWSCFNYHSPMYRYEKKKKKKKVYIDFMHILQISYW